MRTLSADEARRIEALIPRFYHELLSEVDRRAQARQAEDITDECGIALTLWLMTGAAVHPGDEVFADVHAKIGHYVTMHDVRDMIQVLGDHIEDDHAEYLPLFREAVRVPHILALAEQLQAFSREVGVEFDPIENVTRGE